MLREKKKMELRNRESLDTSMHSKENAADLFFILVVTPSRVTTLTHPSP